MASLDQPLPAGTTRAPTRRWNEYTQLSRQLKQAGLLDRRRGWYGARIGLNLVLLAAGGVGFFRIGESWWQLLTAVYLAILATQLAFVGHDAGHRQIFRTRRANDLVGLLNGNLLVGISFGWWVPKHNAHHSNPNDEDLDPDIGIAALAFTAAQARGKRGLARVIARSQAFLFFPLLLLEAGHLHVASMKSILGGRGRANLVEGLLLLVHAAPHRSRPARLHAPPGADLPQRPRQPLRRLPPRRPQLPDRAPPVPEHAPPQPAPRPAPGQRVLPPARPPLRRGQPLRLLRRGPAPPPRRRRPPATRSRELAAKEACHAGDGDDQGGSAAGRSPQRGAPRRHGQVQRRAQGGRRAHRPGGAAPQRDGEAGGGGPGGAPARGGGRSPRGKRFSG